MPMGTDLVPTVLDLLQLPPPTDRLLDGRSILGVLTAGGPTPHDYLYYYEGETLFAVRDQRFKYRGPAGGVRYVRSPRSTCSDCATFSRRKNGR